jgi:tRNA(fMet)-specific endonuclease VapC
MLKSLLDTDILSEYLKGHDSNVIRHAVRYHQQHGVFSFTSVTVHQIVFGLEFKGATSQLQRALRWLRQNEEVTPSADDYLNAAKVRASARRDGTILELPDCLIAAVAVRLGMPIVTGNTADFEKIAATGIPLKLENWRNP